MCFLSAEWVFVMRVIMSYQGRSDDDLEICAIIITESHAQ